MKTIKPRNIPFLFIIISIILIGSCNKNHSLVPDPKGEEIQSNLDEVSISNDFEWNTASNIEFTITAPSAQIITINSIDQNTRYHRGMYTGEGAYKVILSIPNTVGVLLINNQMVSLNSKNIICNLDK